MDGGPAEQLPGAKRGPQAERTHSFVKVRGGFNLPAAGVVANGARPQVMRRRSNFSMAGAATLVLMLGVGYVANQVVMPRIRQIRVAAAAAA